MTVKQAEAIDEKFQALEDSIAKLNNDLNGAITTVNFTQNKVEVTSDNLNQANDSIVKLNKLYLSEVKRQDKLEFIEKRTRKRIGIGLVGSVIAWITFAVLVIKS